MRVGLLGGTFDPVHIGHIKLAQAARRELNLDKVYLVLSPRSPFKMKNKLTPVGIRLKELRAALKNKKGLYVGTWELKGKGPSYTVDSLRRYKKRHGGDDLFLVMGSDVWKKFSHWKTPGQIVQLASIVVGKRPGSLSVRVPKKYKRMVHLLKGRFPLISSTEIRATRMASSVSR